MAILEPTLSNLKKTLEEAPFQVVGSGEDRFIPEEVRKVVGQGPEAPEALCFVRLEFESDDPLKCFQEVFRLVVAVFGRGEFEFESTREGDGKVSVFVTRIPKKERERDDAR